MRRRDQFRDLIERARVDIVQPDLVKCAGLTEAVRIAHLAEAHHKILVPQPDAAHHRPHRQRPLPGLLRPLRAQEYNYAPPRSRTLWSLFRTDLSPRAGWAAVPDGPGLGLELDEAALKAS